MRKLNLRIITLALFFSMGLVSNALAAGKYKDYPVPKACMDQVHKEGNILNIYDWAEWWPEELFKNFTKEFGIKVVRDHYADTEEMVTKFKLNPKLPYDLVLGAGPSDAVRLHVLCILLGYPITYYIARYGDCEQRTDFKSNCFYLSDISNYFL